MDPWLIWLIVAAVLAVVEIFTLTAALGMLSVAALATAGLAGVGLSAPLQLLAYAVLAAATVIFVRPVALRHLRKPQTARFGVDALIGKPAFVVSEVSDTDGRVRIDGDEWTARSYDETLVISAGATVDVMEIRGATVLVYPRE
ncbi:NfeD family protein [Streptomyces sp. NPDC048187]|uniref:NfeD family protein n=1 Tax=Streptomyces sp. NPDC048187 TaxID=3365509 RepID=UPI003721505A